MQDSSVYIDKSEETWFLLLCLLQYTVASIQLTVNYNQDVAFLLPGSGSDRTIASEHRLRHLLSKEKHRGLYMSKLQPLTCLS